MDECPFKNESTTASFSFFQSFHSNNNFTANLGDVKNVRPVSGAGTQTHDLLITSLLI